MIDETEFSKIEFNPTVKESLTTQYPKLKEIVGDVNDKLLRYVILMYDMNSPLKEKYPSLSQRKDFAASMAGYNLEKDDIDSLRTMTKTIKTPKFNDKGEQYGFNVSIEPFEEMLDVVLRLVVYQNNRLWAMIITNEQAFYEYQRRVMAEIGGDADKDALSAITIKTKIMEAMDDIDKRLDGYYKRLTSGDTDLEEVITKRKRLRPEEIAQNVQANR